MTTNLWPVDPVHMCEEVFSALAELVIATAKQNEGMDLVPSKKNNNSSGGGGSKGGGGGGGGGLGDGGGGSTSSSSGGNYAWKMQRGRGGRGRGWRGRHNYWANPDRRRIEEVSSM